MGQTLLKLTIYLLLAGGGLLICDGMWLKVKGMIAQILLKYAWEESVRTGAAVKPWPWADSWPVARLRMDRLGVDHIVLEGDSGEVLAFGPGRLPGSVSPGEDGNCILAGHRDTSFTFLKDLQEGDSLSVQDIAGNAFSFQVVSSHIENRSGLYFERPASPWLTLVTCYPFGSVQPGTEMRYVVFARLEENLPSRPENFTI